MTNLQIGTGKLLGRAREPLVAEWLRARGEPADLGQNRVALGRAASA
jgi:hypothetical protein